MTKKLTLALALLGMGYGLQAQSFVSTTPSNKNVVLEEYTGINCVYCPDGHRRANLIKTANPGRVVLVNVHAGAFAGGTPNLRTTAGNAWDNYASPTGYPSGSVNRTVFPTSSTPGKSAMGRGDWNAAAGTILNQASPVNVAAQGTINWTTREISVDVEAYYTDSSTASTNYVTVALLQNNIASAQAGAGFNPSSIDPNTGLYLHKHALRAVLTPTWGDAIDTTTQGHLFAKTYTYTIPANINGVAIDDLSQLEIAVYVHEGQGNIYTGEYATLTYTSDNAVDFAHHNTILAEQPSPYELGTCGTDATPELVIQNKGNDAITSIEFSYSFNGGTANTTTWTGNIPFSETQTVSLPPIDLSSNLRDNGNNTVSVEITSVNGVAQSTTPTTVNLLRNVTDATSNDVSLSFTTDRYGSEISWTMKNVTDNITMDQGSGYRDTVATTVNKTFTLTNGKCYKLEFNDSYGDGFNYNSGAILFKTASGTTLMSGADFLSKKSVTFVWNGPVAVTDVESVNTFEVFPNPVHQDIHVRFDLAQREALSIEVTNAIGQVVQRIESQDYLPGQQQVTIPTKGMASGAYFVSLRSNSGVKTTRILVAK